MAIAILVMVHALVFHTALLQLSVAGTVVASFTRYHDLRGRVSFVETFSHLAGTRLEKRCINYEI